MLLKTLTFLFVTALAARADELLPVLKVNDQVYSNVTVTTVTATDIYFTSAGGMGNAKLKNLDPELQKHFHYDAAKSLQLENAQTQANAAFDKNLLSAPPVQSRPDDTEQLSSAADGDDFVVPKLYAKSFRGQRAPYFVVEKWITPAPDTSGKFVLIDFWATWCGPCRASIPDLNQLYAKYSDRMTVIGVSDETEADVRKMTSPQINYAVAIDTQKRMMSTLEITGIPHSILIDPRGIVRYEGMPQYLNDQILEHLFEKYK